MPLRLPADDPPPAGFEVRGEVYMTKPGFEKLNEQRADAGLPLFASPRNSAAGSLRQQDPTVTASRPLDIFLYQLGWADGEGAPTRHWDTLQWLGELGFRINPFAQRFTTIDQVIAHVESWEAKRETLDYEIDGLVIKVDEFSLQRALGVRRARAALGHRLQVPADSGDDQAAAHRLQRWAHRRADAVRRARPGHRLARAGRAGNVT